MTLTKAVEKCITALRDLPEIRRATKFLAPNLTVKATRQHPHNRRERSETYIVTVGRPNYAERAFIKSCKRAGEPFPVRRLFVTEWPRKRKA